MLGQDTERLETVAKGFLKSCQKVQVSALARTEMLASSAKQSFDEQVKVRVEDYGFVMKEALEYYAQQNQRIQETRDRLVSMNVSLPVQIVVRPLSLSLEDDDGQFFARPEDDIHSIDEASETPEGSVGFGSFDRFANAMEELTFFAEKSLQQDANDGYYQRLTVETIAIQAVSHTESSSQELSSSRSNNGSFFFYAFVACISAGYLWNSITDMKRKTLAQKKWAWSPVPKLLGHLKAILKSVVVRWSGVRPSLYLPAKLNFLCCDAIHHALTDHRRPPGTTGNGQNRL
ncbi:hypothetical protein BBJ28_00024615 [Nothophytophthora sp. Chile5]|nr:hypothetical protein BBJ28_00024615 [Nothophytophthora sp. Chile5]